MYPCGGVVIDVDALVDSVVLALVDAVVLPLVLPLVLNDWVADVLALETVPVVEALVL